MLRAFRGTKHTSPKSNLTKEKRLSRQTSKPELLLAETDLAIAIPKARGLDPRRSPGRMSLYTRPSSCGSTVEPAVPVLRADDRPLWRGLLVLLVQPCTQK